MTTLREEIQTAIVIAALNEENKFENGEVNWDFVDSDVCISFGDHFKLIGQVLNEVAEKVEAALKKEAQREARIAKFGFPEIDFGGPLRKIDGTLMGQTKEEAEFLISKGAQRCTKLADDLLDIKWNQVENDYYNAVGA